MIKVEKCLLCGKENLSGVKASIAPFIRSRCNIHGPLPNISRLYCKDCDFSFFDHRFSEDEAKLLYAGYRDERYNALRLELEPTWTDIYKNHSDRSSLYHRIRIEQLSLMFPRGGTSPSRVLDFGGEEDAWLAKGTFPDSEVQTYDISFEADHPTTGNFDVVICSQVLEHVSYPIDVVSNAAKHLCPGGLLYLEVPIEAYDLENTFLPGHPLNRMHEHISHFSIKSISRLIHFSGLSQIKINSIRNVITTSVGALCSRHTGSTINQEPEVQEHHETDSPLLPASMERIHQRSVHWVRDKTRIVIYPAGAYTMELLAYTALKDACVKALSDKNEELHSTVLMGKRVIPPASIPEVGTDLVLIASPLYEEQIASDLKWLESFGIKLVKCSEIS